MFDSNLLRKALDQNLEYKVAEAFTSEGKRAPDISLMTSFLAELYQYHPPEKITWRFMCIVTHEELELSMGKVIHRAELYNDFNSEKCIVLINADKCLVLDYQAYSFDYSKAILYNFEHFIEGFIANNKNVEVPNPDSSTISIFAKPTFKDLDEALWVYYRKRAAKSICPTLKGCWTSADRLRFKAGPEHTMRDSLYLFLDTGLRGSPVVKREQNVDDTDPVDIKVSWKYTNAAALIEIKWLGKSFDIVTQQQTKDHSQQRAIDGAEQLKQYLKVSKEENPEIFFQGYLVVYDGRRRGMGKSFTTIPDTYKAWYYKDQEIPYPDHLKTDDSLHLTYRFYLEPNVS